MKDFRVTVVFDYSVPDDTDEDEFHDDLRNLLEDGQLEHVRKEYRLETVREINVEIIDD